MHYNKKDDLEWLQFALFSKHPEIVQAIFLRPLNLAPDKGDPLEIVEANKERVRTLLGLKDLVSVKQTHGVSIVHVESPRIERLEGDVLITQLKEVGLLIQHGDCQAALMYDPKQGVIANVHVGWRGSVQNIYAKVIEEMYAKFGSNPKDILVAISPSLGPEHAEFIHYARELPESFWPFQWKPNYFDFWKISLWQLMECGIKEDNIEIARMCTYADSKSFFSYRRDKITGRHGSIIGLRS